MPQETISIRNFGGMMTNPHKEDIPDNMAVYALNIDPQTELGTLRGIEQNGASYTANSTAIPDVYEADWINYEVSGSPRWDLIYVDRSDDDISAIENFYGAEAARALTDLVTTGIVPECVKTFNNTAQIGNGIDDKAISVYRLLANKACFNGGETITAGLLYEESECYNAGTLSGFVSGNFYPIACTDPASTGYFQTGVLYQWAVSFVVDGIQESNLTGLEEGGANSVIPSTGGASSTVTIRAYDANTNFTNMDKRVTAVKLYRAESSDAQFANLGLYRLVKTIDINDAGWTVDTDHYDYDYTDDGSYEGGQTYEEETGIPETLRYQSVRYAINEVGGGYHWVTVGQPENESDIDWSRYIFRSKKFRPNMFDWTRDFLVLPEIPTALAWYNDRLYAFSNNITYRINPELMYIEDTFFGAGAMHRQSVFVSEYGLYFCNVNGAYRIQDSGIDFISDPIAETPTTGSYLGWKLFASQSSASAFAKIVVKAEVDKRIVLFIGSTSGNTIWALGFYVPTGQWFAYGIGGVAVDADSGAYGGKDGEVYISNATASYRLFNSANFENTVWVSKEFHLNEPSQNKSWNKIKWDATTPTGSSFAVTYGTEGTDPATSATNDAWINTYKKTFQIKIAGTAATTNNPTMDSIDIIARRLYGKR